MEYRHFISLRTKPYGALCLAWNLASLFEVLPNTATSPFRPSVTLCMTEVRTESRGEVITWPETAFWMVGFSQNETNIPTKYVCLPTYDGPCCPRGRAVSRTTMMNHRMNATNAPSGEALEGDLALGPLEAKWDGCAG